MKTSKRKKVTIVNGKTLIVALDIHKDTHSGYFRTPGNEELEPFPVQNSGYGFKKLWKKICCFQKKHGLDEIMIGFESSGPYAEPLCNFFRKKPVKLVQINPMHTKRLKELTGNSPNKTDKKDPRVIADIISLGHALTVVIPEGAAAELRSLSHARERSVKDVTAYTNQLHDLMYKIFPEFLKIMKGTTTKSAFYLIKNCTLPEDIVQEGLGSLTHILKKVSRGRMGYERAQELFEAALNSIGIKEGKQSILMEIKHLVCIRENMEQFINNLENHMEEYLEQIPYSQSMLSVRGISTVTVAGLIGEVGNFKAFTTSKEIEKMAGLDLYEVSSGKHKGQRRISKRGRSLMRKLLYYAAVNTVKSNGIMHSRYQAMLARGMPKIKALIAIARKLLRLIYAIARDNSKYIENKIKTDTYIHAA